MYSLPEIDSFAFLHHVPYVSEATVVVGSLDDDGKQAEEHDHDLERVCPYDSLHSPLQYKRMKRL